MSHRNNPRPDESSMMSSSSTADWTSTFRNPATHLQLLQSDIDYFHDLKLSASADEENLREHLNLMHSQMAKDEGELDVLLDRVTEIKRTIKELRASINHLSTLREGRKRELDKKQELNAAPEDTNTFSDDYLSSNLTHLSETVGQLERVFGMRLQRTTSNSLQLLFYGCSGPAAPDIVCSCQLRYNKIGRYEPVKCNPPVPDFERLVNHLNLTSDMRNFVILLRHRFRRYFELAAAVSSKVD
ncbi:hypothetical protein CLF_101938 [Clonorchis sinensis]|uniref:Kinetochore protein SPC25 n=1 Tax=Clonorchis sinensis TaxID=79923 RepID=H2KPG6_CLOSI|nr:hypothetical protein CLF_101938 [Clonorchis sinensis]